MRQDNCVFRDLRVIWQVPPKTFTFLSLPLKEDEMIRKVMCRFYCVLFRTVSVPTYHVFGHALVYDVPNGSASHMLLAVRFWFSIVLSHKLVQ